MLSVSNCTLSEEEYVSQFKLGNFMKKAIGGVEETTFFDLLPQGL